MNLKDLVEKKKSERSLQGKLDLNDINRDLIISLFSISIYGKEAHDDEILEIIIGNETNPFKKKMKENFDKRKQEAGAKLKKAKDGYLRHNGLIILKPI